MLVIGGCAGAPGRCSRVANLHSYTRRQGLRQAHHEVLIGRPRVPLIRICGCADGHRLRVRPGGKAQQQWQGEQEAGQPRPQTAGEVDSRLRGKDGWEG